MYSTHGLYVQCNRIVLGLMNYSVGGMTAKLGPRQCRNAHLSASPTRARMDEHVHIQVQGLNPGHQVTLATQLTEEGETFTAHGHYEADTKGQIDLNSHASLGGSFQGNEPMGLFSLLHPVEGSRSGIRIRKKDVTVPHIIKLLVLDGYMTYTTPKIFQHKVIDSVQFERHYLWEDVARVPVRHGNIRGTLFIPKDGEGKHQGIIDLYGSNIGLNEYRAAMLASRGFTTLALAFAGYDDLPKELNVKYEYLLEAIEYLSSHPNVCPGGIGIIGISFGAMLGLDIAAYSQKVLGVVSIGGAGMFFGGVENVTKKMQRSFEGKTMGEVVGNSDDAAYNEHGLNIRQLILNAKEEGNGKVMPENAPHTHFLFVHGSDDQNIDARLCVRVVERIIAAGNPHVSLHLYQDAGHLIEPPYIPHSYASWHNMFKTNLIWGGKALPHAWAQEDAWRKILSFFKRCLPSADG